MKKRPKNGPDGVLPENGEAEAAKTGPADGEEEQPAKKRASPVRTAVLVLLLLAVVVAAALAIREYSKRKADSEMTAEGFYAVSADTVVSVMPYADGVAVLTANGVEYVDHTGTLLQANEHNYASPAMAAAGKNVILYDRGGTKLRIEKSTNRYNELEFGSAVSCADITEKGVYAFSLNQDAGYQSHVYVYSRQDKVLLEWGSGSGCVLTMSLSPNGKALAVGLYTVENAEYTGKVICFRFGQKEPVYTTEFKGQTVYGVSFQTKDTLAVLTDKGAYMLDKNGDPTQVCAYAANEMNRSSLTRSGLCAVAVKRFGNDTDALVTVFGAGTAEPFDRSFDTAVHGVAAGTGYTAVVLGDQVIVFNGKDEDTGKVALKEPCVRAVISGKRLYVLTASGLYSYHVNESYGGAK